MSFFRNEIERLKLKQEDITEICGVRRQTVTSWSKGETPIPSDKLAVMAKIGVDVQYVITGTRNPACYEQPVDRITREQVIDTLDVLLKRTYEQANTIKVAIDMVKNLG